MYKGPQSQKKNSDWALVLNIFRWVAIVGIILFALIYGEYICYFILIDIQSLYLFTLFFQGSMQNLQLIKSRCTSSSWIKSSKSTRVYAADILFYVQSIFERRKKKM
jgi:hypothetical protein